MLVPKYNNLVDHQRFSPRENTLCNIIAIKTIISISVCVDAAAAPSASPST